MTTFNAASQYGAMYGGQDVAVQNTALVDLPSGSAIILDTANPISGTQQAPGVILPASAGGAQGGGLGITMYDIPAPTVYTPDGGPTAITVFKSGIVRRAGSAVGVSDGNITVGARVRASATALKMGRVKACGAGEAQFGIARNTTVDGDAVIVDFAFATNA